FVLRKVWRERVLPALLRDAIDERIEADAAIFLARPSPPQRDGPRLCFFVTDDEHVARLSLLRFLDAVAQIAGLLVEVHAEIIRAQLRRDAARVFERGLADRDDRDLLPVEP